MTIHKLKVNSRRNSTCGSARLGDLDWSNWRTDASCLGRLYLHVQHSDGETWHRVFCRFKSARLAFRCGVLCWLVKRGEVNQ